MQLALLVEGRAHEVQPRARGQIDAHRQGVEEQAEHEVAVLFLGPAARHQAAHDVRPAGHEPDRTQVRREEHALQRHPGTLREGPQRRRQLGDRAERMRPRLAEAACAGGTRRESGRHRGAAPRPEATRVVVARAPFERDEVAEAIAGDAPRARVVAGKQAAVATEQLRDQRVEAPAVEDRVELRDRELKSRVVEPMHEDPEERRLRPAKAAVALALDRGVDRGFAGRHGQVREVVEQARQRRLIMHELQRLGEAREVKRRAQDRVAAHEGADRVLELGRIEGRVHAQARDVVVRRARAGQLGVEHHAGLQQRQRIGVGDALGHPRAVLLGDEGERRQARLRERCVRRAHQGRASRIVW